MVTNASLAPVKTLALVLSVVTVINLLSGLLIVNVFGACVPRQLCKETTGCYDIWDEQFTDGDMWTMIHVADDNGFCTETANISWVRMSMHDNFITDGHDEDDLQQKMSRLKFVMESKLLFRGAMVLGLKESLVIAAIIYSLQLIWWFATMLAGLQ